MFGIRAIKKREIAFDEKLAFVLRRKGQIEALKALTEALGTAQIPDNLRDCAIALDSSVFLKLAAHEKSADVIDYINALHTAGVILPGQSVQEFWNNRYNAVPSLARKLRNSFDKFSNQIEELDRDFGDFRERFQTLISEFESDHGHVFDERTVTKTSRMLEALANQAIVPFVDRQGFHRFAEYRQNTKTPPGFRDERGNDGDFFVWLDVLRGVQLICSDIARPSHLIFVTDDKKDDWSRDGMPHPVLTAELQAISGVKLCIVDLAKFIKLVEQTAT